MTVMVPLGNVAFTFDFMPEHEPLATKDVVGLVVIMMGLFIYRFTKSLILMPKLNVLRIFMARKRYGDQDIVACDVSSPSNELLTSLLPQKEDE